MGGEQKRTRQRSVSWKIGNQVTHVATHLFSCVVDPHGCPQLFHFSFEAHGDVEFLPRQTVDLNQLDEKILESFLIDQNINLLCHFAKSPVIGSRATRLSNDVTLPQVPHQFQEPNSGILEGLEGKRSEEHTSELQSHHDLVCRLLLEKKKK